MALVRTDVSEELSASIITLVTLMMEELISSETSVPTRATRITSQKKPFLIVTAVETSNRTSQRLVAGYSSASHHGPIISVIHRVGA
jgi:hypothetical protein